MYVKKIPPRRAAPRRRGLFGFGDDNTDSHGCTPDQVWNDTAGACVSLDDNLKIINAGVSSAGTSSSSSSSSPGVFDAFLKALLPAPAPPMMMPPPSGGISTSTILLVGGGLIAVLLLTRK